MKRVDGFDEAILGIGRKVGQPDIFVYDAGVCIDILMKRDGMSLADATEYLEFKVEDIHTADDDPVWLSSSDDSIV
tara:strand:- start:166 stop:393 length:228 start_codon:yes stop_codon:yes gene_type:complete